MLRLLVAALIAANLLFFAYARGTFDGMLGLSSHGDREPERLTRQVRADTIRVLPAGAAASGGATSSCLEAGPVAEIDAAAAQAALAAALPAGAWTDIRSETNDAGTTPVVTHVYRVPTADPATVNRLLAITLAPGGRYPFATCPTGSR